MTESQAQTDFGMTNAPKYLGVKIVKARPMTQREYANLRGTLLDNDQNPPKDGYMVQYEDGYISWCPAEQFAKANRPVSGLSFGHAIEAMNKGLKVKLPHWKEDVFISMQFPDSQSKMTHKYMYVTSRFGLVPWIPTQIEMLSDDWMIVE